ncbi:MAG TPA: TetR family transcriptional regulator [Solirubrobacteraceae bacterium]|nr:TetR family transcriptional regulator [Solirubrobacteraceae bacterium]
MSARRSGRRPGQSGTREAILAAARRQFAARGYDRTSMRGVAAEAGVDQALVAHFFGSKQRLFVEVARLPFEPREVLPRLLEGDRDGLGERIARFIVGVLEDPEGRARVTGVVRAAASEPEVARMLREFMQHELWSPLADQLAVADADLRVTLVASQIVGMVMVRHVVAAEPLASLPGEELVELLAPALQRILYAAPE